jgi:hypothetical protein
LVAPERRVPASAVVPSPATVPAPAILAIGGRIVASDAPGLCEGARRALHGRAGEPLVCDVGAVASTDVGTVEAIARVALGARRLGSPIRLRAASPELRGLLDLMGLADVVPCEGGSALEPRRQPEEREELRGVEEEVDPGDLAV